MLRWSSIVKLVALATVATPAKFINTHTTLALSTHLASSTPHITCSMTVEPLTFAVTASGHHPDLMTMVSLDASRLNPTRATTFRNTTNCLELTR